MSSACPALLRMSQCKNPNSPDCVSIIQGFIQLHKGTEMLKVPVKGWIEFLHVQTWKQICIHIMQMLCASEYKLHTGKFLPEVSG